MAKVSLKIERFKLKSGCKILVHPVKSPELYGVAIINRKRKIVFKGEGKILNQI